MSDEKLWDFALRHYTAEGVASACLDVQDHWQVDIPLLFYAGWMGARGVLLAPSDLALADRAVAEWREQVILPLRHVRRRMKTGPLPASSDDSEALRANVKSAELQAEKLQLELLERDFAGLGRAQTDPAIAIPSNIISLTEQVRGTAEPDLPMAALRHIMAALTTARAA